MNKRNHSSWLVITLALLLGMMCFGAQLNAQQAAPPSDQPSQSQPDAQQPSQQDQAQQSGQAPSDSQKQAPDQSQQQGQAPSESQKQAPGAQSQSQGQTFVGTIIKSGDKFVLQDASGTSYDIDHQDLVKKFEGKQVRVNGTLDQDTKTIDMK